MHTLISHKTDKYCPHISDIRSRSNPKSLFPTSICMPGFIKMCQLGFELSCQETKQTDEDITSSWWRVFAGRGGTPQRRHKVDYQAKPDVRGQDHLCEGSRAQRGGPLHWRLHLHSGTGEGLQRMQWHFFQSLPLLCRFHGSKTVSPLCYCWK